MRGGEWTAMDGEPACRSCVGKLNSFTRQEAAPKAQLARQEAEATQVGEAADTAGTGATDAEEAKPEAEAEAATVEVLPTKAAICERADTEAKQAAHEGGALAEEIAEVGFAPLPHHVEK